MAKASIKCARCDNKMTFGAMSRSMAGSVSQHDAVANIARMVGWTCVGSEWRCKAHAHD